ncbi:hypothetical protein JL111_20090 [Paracoccus sp. KCTC 42845]|uniref:Transketolase-like pyrimidine-binding domain-containing protein n=1 Tax=Paracoccus aerius TaxID=1915382 RepID=A0ABS1SAK2_9RHOB|nr:hypothetical protein [Paracoccus aerius]
MDTLDVGDFASPVNVYGNANMPSLYGEAIVRLAEADARVVCLGADLTASTETNLFQDRFPDRLFHMGIAEANMVGAAAGMARSGDIPFLHSFSVFATRRCYDQIAMQMAYPRTNVKIAGFMPGLSTLLGVSHQAIDDVALIRALPNMMVMEPGLPEDVHAIVQAAYLMTGPVYMRMRRFENPANPSIPVSANDVLKGRILREGNDVAILTSGMMVDVSLQAAEALASTGVEARVINICTLKPLNEDIVTTAAKECGAVVTAENHSIIGGLGSAVAETLMEAGLTVPFKRVGIADTFAEGGSTPYLFQKYGLSAAAVENAAKSLLAG